MSDFPVNAHGIHPSASLLIISLLQDRKLSVSGTLLLCRKRKNQRLTGTLLLRRSQLESA
jgi:hypothetical protein